MVFILGVDSPPFSKWLSIYALCGFLDVVTSAINEMTGKLRYCTSAKTIVFEY